MRFLGSPEGEHSTPDDCGADRAFGWESISRRRHCFAAEGGARLREAGSWDCAETQAAMDAEPKQAKG